MARRLSCFLFSFFVVLACSWSAFACSYTVAIVPHTGSRELFEAWAPILANLEKKTGCAFTARFEQSVAAFHENALTRDFMFANPLKTLRASKERNFIPLIHAKKKLQGIIVVRKDDPVTAQKDLKLLNGERFAVASLKSFGASVLTQSELKQQGITVQAKSVGTHEDVFILVAKGLFRAGGSIASTFKKMSPDIQNLLVVVHETKKSPPHAFSARPGIDQALREKIVDAFLEMGKTQPELLAKASLGDPVPANAEEYQVLSDFLSK
jgi:phosphonate transport system substrate-binding protein